MKFLLIQAGPLLGLCRDQTDHPNVDAAVIVLDFGVSWTI